ncbi:MAG: DUF262 domain-containing protein [Clostridiales bacterium]|nr:DUF262 domain-containing protein [Clostridiales bacterium]
MAENIKTLIGLLNEHEVRIPIIQRDYAQGRENEKSNEVRKNLLRDIKNCLSDRNQYIDFNFVYGTLSDGVFYPVDGQQRLTTLYLLHWFLACNCNRHDDFKRLKIFSYMTRNSATEFFKLLRGANNQLKELVRNSNKLKKDIGNQAWFQAEWAHDPTVDAALTLLDDLSKDSDFRINSESYYNRLEGGAVEFTHIIEKGDRAELKAAKSYIRMNARGKSLEPFENLKAMLDSIDDILKKFDKFTNIVSKYDGTYIDPLYNQCNGQNLLKKTEDINKKSLNCLKNIYNLNCQLANKNSISGEASFINEMHEYSQKTLNDEEKVFFFNFFNMTISVFDYFVEEPHDELIKTIFESREDFDVNENRPLVATVLYIYYRKESSINKEIIEKYKYVLENLKYEEWSRDYLKSINSLTKSVSKHDDVFCYFNCTSVVDIQDICVASLEDICVRIKEQKIKVDIIKEENKKWDFFKKIELKTYERKIQYLLYISGYWIGKGSFEKLEEFMGISYKYFLVVSNDLMWRKNYAIASYLNHNGSLLTETEINKNCGSRHIWYNSYYYWTDADEKSLNQLKPELEIIKKAYEYNDKISEFRRLLNTSVYDLCWLRYAVKFDHKPLLDKELEWDSNHQIVRLKHLKHRYDVYIMHIEFKKRYYFKELTETAQSDFVFEIGVTYETTDKNISFKNYNFRRYIMRLNVPVVITKIHENYKFKDYCLHNYDEDLSVYTVYEVKSPYILEQKTYNIYNEIQKQLSTLKAEQLALNLLSKDDYLEIKERGRIDWRQNGRKTSWNKTSIKVPYLGTTLTKRISLTER